MQLRKKFYDAASLTVQNFVMILETLEHDSSVQKAMSKTGKGLSFKEMALEDTISAFEDVMRDVSTDAVPMDFYAKLLNERTGRMVSESDAEKVFEKRVQAKAGSKPAKGAPEFLKAVWEDLQPEMLEEVANMWFATVQNFAQLIISEDALLATTSAREVATSAAMQVESQLRKAMGSTPPGGGRVPVQRTNGRGVPVPTNGGVPQTKNAPADLPADIANILNAFGEDLTEKARKGELPEVVGRKKEITQVLAATIQEDNPFALTVGREGSGKSAVTFGLAQRIVDGKVPKKLEGAKVIRLKLKEMKAQSGQSQKGNAMTGEMSMVDQFNDRLYTILHGVAEYNKKGGTQIILNIDELGEMTSRIPNFFQAKDILAAVMSGTNTLRLVTEMTDQKFNQLETESSELLGQFHKVNVEPLSVENTVKVLQNEAKALEKKTGIKTNEADMEKLVKMATRFMAQKAQPASALDVLEAAIAYAEINGDETVDLDEHVVSVISNQTGVPSEFIGSSLSDRIASLGDHLPNKVLGQDEAIGEIVASMKVANANMQDPNKPLGSFLMIGPTGVGKTETAKALAEHLGVELIVEDMSNYQDRHAKAKLVGAPPGYVGFDKEAALEQVAKHPYSVLLLDEIEKAHPEVFNSLLSVLDEGRLQLMNGKVVDFRNTIILMTSNLGAKEAEAAREKKPMLETGDEFDSEQAAAESYEQSINEKLPPEFINRLDGILNFNRLTEPVVRKIAEIKSSKVIDFLKEKNSNLTLEFTKAAMDDLFEAGYDPRYGARPMDRAIKKFIKMPLSEWYIEKGSEIKTPTTVKVKGLKDSFDVELIETAQAMEAPKTKKPSGPAPS